MANDLKHLFEEDAPLMHFQPALAGCLARTGFIYTARKYRYRTRFCSIQGIGRCLRQHVDTINKKQDLTPYSPASGFVCVDAWWKELKRLNKGYVGPFYLYEITTEPKCEVITEKENE